MKKWKLGLFLLLLLLVMSPVFSQDTSYVKVEKQDWEAIQQYYQTSQKELKELSSELEKLQNLLEQSKIELTTLTQQAEISKTSFLNMQESLRKEQNRNKTLKISLGITSGISIGLVITGLIILLIR